MRRGTLALLAGGLVGKTVGVLREVLLAALFGTGAAASSYRIAQAATLVPVNFFTADALTAGFLPSYIRMLSTDARLAGLLYVWVQRILYIVSGFVVILLVIFRQFWVQLFAPGFSAPLVEETSLMLVIMALGVPFYIATAIGSYLAIGHNLFTLASARSSVQSAGLIAGTFLAFFLRQPLFLAIGFTAAYILMAVWTKVYLARHAITPSMQHGTYSEVRFVLALFWRATRLNLTIPLFLQGSYVVERALASLVSSQAVPALDYAKLVTDTGVILVATPIGTAVLAHMSNMGQTDASVRTGKLLNLVLVASFPASIALCGFAPILVQVIYSRGQFDRTSFAYTTFTLQGLSIGLGFQVVAYVFIKVLNARQMNSYAAFAAILGSVVMVAFDFLTFRHLGVLGLGLGESAGAAAQCVVALRRLGLLANLVRQSATLLPLVPVLLALLWLQSVNQIPPLAWICTMLFPLIVLLWVVTHRQLRRSSLLLYQTVRNRRG